MAPIACVRHCNVCDGYEHPDILIAGTALAHQAILVARNVKEFKHVEKLQVELVPLSPAGSTGERGRDPVLRLFCSLPGLNLHSGAHSPQLVGESGRRFQGLAGYQPLIPLST